MLTALLMIATAALLDTHSPMSEGAGNILTVTSDGDSGDGSLRAVLGAADNGDTITFDSSIATITLMSEIAFNQSDITIDGGTGGVTITKAVNSNFRLLYSKATTGTLTLMNLIIENGLKTSSIASEVVSGAGVHADCAITAENCTFSGNRATSSTTGATGGGVYAGTGAYMTNCTFSDNTSRLAGAGLYVNSGDTVLTNCTFSGNRSTGSAGGGVYSNSNVYLSDCTFTGNIASGGNGGGVRAFGNVTGEGCTFTNNSTTGSSNSSGGGIWSNNNVFLNGCVFTGNMARTHGSGVSLSNVASLLVLTNCTFSGNMPYTTNPTNVGTIECSIKTYIFQTTITNNQGGGIYAATGKNVYLYNSIVTGNTDAAGTSLLQIIGTFNNISSLVEGEAIPSGSDTVTNRQVFGMNAFDPASGIHAVLGNGIAFGTANSIALSNILGYAGLSANERAIMDSALAALAADQTGDPRAVAPGAVTYGAVEVGENTLDSIAVDTEPKTEYAVGEAIVLTGTVLELNYSNGTETVPYDEPGMHNTSGSVDMSTVGDKQIDFAFLGVSTADTGTGLIIKVTDGTSAELTLSSDTSVYGEEITISVLVHPENTYGIPTGTVTFYDGGADIGTVPLDAYGMASLTSSSLSLGSHTITAAYSGSVDYGASASASSTHTVGIADTFVTVESITVTAAGDVTITARLYVASPGSDSLLNRTVYFEDTYDASKHDLGSYLCDAFGNVSFTLNSAQIATIFGTSDISGTHLIKAIFEKDGNLDGCESADFMYDAANPEAGVDITISPPDSPTPPVYGQGVTITVALSSWMLGTGASAGGGKNVTLYDWGTEIGTYATELDGTFTLNTVLSVGSHNIIAEFIGDETLNAGISSNVVYLVDSAKTTTTINDLTLISPVYGDTVEITAAVSVDSPGDGDLTGGTVIFYDYFYDGISYKSVIIDIVACDENGAASVQKILSVGSHYITVLFIGDKNLKTSSAVSTCMVGKAETETLLDSDPNPSSYGETVTFIATVEAISGGSGTPTGTVEFRDNGAYLGEVDLISGKAVFSTDALGVGSHTQITAIYNGDENYNTSMTLTAVDQTVDQAITTTSVSSSPNPSVFGEEVNFIAQVRSSAGVSPEDGSVQFYIDGSPVGSPTALDGDGRAAYSDATLSIGNYIVTAKYTDVAGNYSDSESDPIDHRVIAAPAGAKNYYITVSADSGSTIYPNGTVSVQGGESKTFTFSAKNGYHITDVAVDGVSLSQAQMDSGSYTFYNVNMNHTIEMKSAAGNDPRYDDSENGNGNGSDNGKDNGNGDNNKDNTNSDGDSSDWTLWWIVLIVVLLIILFIIFMLWRRRKKDEEEDGNTQR